jgi:hypothetical protein
MKKLIPIALLALMAAPLFADPKDDVVAAASKLAYVGNYSWKATMDLGPNSQYTPGPTEGKIDKDGTTWLSVTFNDNTLIGVKMGDKVAVKGEDGWQTGAEVTADSGSGGRNPGRMMARRMETLKAPASEVQDLLTKSKELSKDGDAFTANLTEEGAKALATMGRGRRGGNPPTVTDTKGSVKFWIKDGVLSKYETKVSGKRERNGEEREFERTTTVEISNVGETKLNLPEDAKKKLS